MKETNSDIEVINLNLNNHIFYHGTSSTEDVIKICKEGFKSYWIDEDGKCDRDGNLGIGIYLTCNWKTAVWFGNILLRTSLRKGTRIIDTSQAPDKAVVAYLKKEFGNDIIKSHNIRKVLPKNKQLKLHELVALTRYHYNKTWEKD